MNYILFVKKECPFCVQAEELLSEHDLNYSLIKFQEDQGDILQEIKNAYDWKTVPMVFARSDDSIKFVGGYTDLVDFLTNEQQRR
tara:strand:+ start:184 stop:438 length:255 start_codon:yes stop_codon:yes gene_type:complete